MASAPVGVLCTARRRTRCAGFTLSAWFERFLPPSDPDSSCWAVFCLRAASTAHFLPLLAELKRSSASSPERQSNPDQDQDQDLNPDPSPDRFTAVPPLHLPGPDRAAAA